MKNLYLFARLRRFFVAGILASLFLVISCQMAFSQSEYIAPGDNLVADGIPKIPASLAPTVKPYTGIYGLPLASWNPTKREVWLKGISSVAWISRIERPGSSPQTSTYIPVAGVYNLYFQPQAKYLVYNRDTNGNETFQMYLYNIETHQSTLLSDVKSRNTEPVWSHAGDRIIYSSSPQGSNGVSLNIVNPLDPKTNRLLALTDGGYLKVYSWSPDDHNAVFCNFTSNTISTLWMINVVSGEKTLLSPEKGKEDEYYDYPQFSKDGKGIYVVTDHDSDVRRLAYIDLATKQFRYLSNGIKWDVDEFQLAPDGKTIAFTINEDGVSRLHLLNIQTNQEQPAISLPTGIISDLKWHNNSIDLAFNFKSPRTPNDVYSIDIKTGKIERWSKGVTNGVDTEKFSLPEITHWKSFDGRTISGFLYRPPARFTGKRPVIIDIHGGPEEQYRPGFGYDDNYFLNELGVAKIYPNIRGSSGYGKTFLNLDNGVHREEALKDIGALLDWIKTQPDLDADRVMIQGASYGGYMAFSAAVNYSDRIRAAISDSGPSDLAAFIEHTEGWRRDIQRAEFGDERNPKTKEFMERTAPLNNIQKISKPLMIIQGKNDPRVPASESEAIVQAAKKNGIPVWYLLAKDEGHGFVQQGNRDFRLYSTILFTKEYLLK